MYILKFNEFSKFKERNGMQKKKIQNNNNNKNAN